MPNRLRIRVSIVKGISGSGNNDSHWDYIVHDRCAEA